MKKSDAFREAQIAVLSTDLSIKRKLEVLEMLLEEEYFAKIYEKHKEEKENATL